MAVLFLVVFIDLVGFGLLIPLLPFYVQRVGADPTLITIVLGLYSLAQFVAAPLWGRLSDKHGRKPVLVLTLIGLAASYLVLARADSLVFVIASRIVGGVMAGNIAAAQAYVADVTTPETRARGMGLLGAAFGLGFIFGPVIGGLLAGDDWAGANFAAPAYAAMVLSGIAAAAVFFFLKESRPANARANPSHVSFTAKMHAAFARRTLVLLVLTGFCVITAWAQFETTLALWTDAVLAFGPREIGLTLGAIGIVNVLVQGLMMGTLTRLFGERALAVTAALLFVAGYAALAAAASPLSFGIACAVLALALALFNPAVTSLVSQEAGDDERGAVMGAYQSATALGRVAGPAFSGALFTLGLALPFFAAAVLAAVGLIFLALAGARQKTSPISTPWTP